MIDTRLSRRIPVNASATRASFEIRDYVSKCMDRSPHLRIPAYPKTRSSRLRFLRKASHRADGISFGIIYDKSCKIAAWAHLDEYITDGPYMGLSVTRGQVNFHKARNRSGPEFSVNTDIIVDLSVIRSLISAGMTAEIEKHIEALRPAISWCLIANRLDCFGRFMVPVENGIFICARETLPAPTKDGTVTGARVMAFRPVQKMRKLDIENWNKLRSLQINDATPPFPFPYTASKDLENYGIGPMSSMMFAEALRYKDRVNHNDTIQHWPH